MASLRLHSSACMGNARTTLSLRCNLRTQPLCLRNSLMRQSVSINLATVRGNAQKSLSSFRNAHNRVSPTQFISTTDAQTFTPKHISYSSKTAHGLNQHAASFSTASPNSQRSQNSQKEPDDKSELDAAVAHVRDKQVKTPWEREGSQIPPVKRNREASAMTKGKLLTTPSRLLKLVLPVTTHDFNSDRKDVEPLALLVHPQQPLSYLERLIQAEVPPVEDKNGKMHPPLISFLAVEDHDSTIQPKKPKAKEFVEDEPKDTEGAEEDGPKDPSESMVVTKNKQAPRLGEPPDMEGQKSEIEHGTESKPKPDRSSFVKWSSSTEIGDFIRDAARVKEFLVDIENSPLGRIPVAVPSFNDRTYYLRMRLRKVSRQLKHLAIVKQECDALAHRGAQRVALGGLGVMVSWWYIVYALTFETDYGWDTMEPITYLVSLSTLMGGYAWFLYHNREMSYRSALDFTVSRRQQKLYQTRGIDLQVWERLLEEANGLRREIKTVAEEYDVDWDERADEEDERVTEALKHERKRQERKQEEEKRQEKDSEKAE